MNEAEAEAAVDRAILEGRVHGKFRCARCGMRSNEALEAQECCRELGPPSCLRVSGVRFERGA